MAHSRPRRRLSPRHGCPGEHDRDQRGSRSDGMDDPGAGRAMPDEVARFGSSTTRWRSPPDSTRRLRYSADGRVIGPTPESIIATDAAPWRRRTLPGDPSSRTGGTAEGRGGRRRERVAPGRPGQVRHRRLRPTACDPIRHVVRFAPGARPASRRPARRTARLGGGRSDPRAARRDRPPAGAR